MKALNPLMILYHSIGWPVLMRNMYTTTGGYKYAISFISSHRIMPHIFLHLDIEYLVNEWLEELSSSCLECEDLYIQGCALETKLID